MTAPAVTYRLLAPGDADRTFVVFREALNDYLARAGQELLPDEDDQAPGFRHVLRTDGPRCWGADQGGELVAWGTALLRGDWWFLSSLFVLPQAQGHGIGRELLRRCLGGTAGASVLATVTDSLQPVSNTLYARHGMLPREALLGLGGAPRLSALAAPRSAAATGGRAGLDPEPLTPGSVPDLCTVDAGVMGIDRAVDHAFYLGDGGRRGWLFRRAGRPVAYAMYRLNGFVGPLACLDSGDVGPVLRHALTGLVAHGIETVRVNLPAPCEEAQRVLWDAGLSFAATPGLLLASRPFGRLDRYVPAGYGMF
jgi:GNAT superfamily N-acetyltransferase